MEENAGRNYRINPPSGKDLGITILILAAVTGIGFIFSSLKFTEANIITVYILGTLLTALFTKNYICSGVTSLLSVMLFNFFFTEPRLTFHAYESGYPVTFVIMLTASLITGTLANRLAESVQLIARAKNEQLRADLLRMISHDLRTPLTTISGNAEYLILNDGQIDETTRKQVLRDMQEDALWLNKLVENMLSVSRMNDGKLELNMTAQLVDEVIQEALRHVGGPSSTHKIAACFEEDLLLAKMDARLISQVVINLVDNAIKYTPEGSEIWVRAKREKEYISVSISDNGPGIRDELKEKVFEMFFTGEHKVADCRRSLGLGLALCRTIIEAHGGKILLKDNQPSGCNFVFTLPVSEVNLNE